MTITEQPPTTSWAPCPPRGISITHPNAGPDLMDGNCRVTVMSWRVDERDNPAPPTVDNPGYHLRYQSYCGGCGHCGPIRSGENQASEDGVDHAYPGWRDMPVLDECPHDDLKAIARWQENARAVYPEGWFDRKGPVREYRRPGGTRHVPKGAPGGGYCMAVRRTAPTAEQDKGVQESLFD